MKEYSINSKKVWYNSSPVLKHAGLELRDYQVEAAWASNDANTLVVLPTGLGKTIVALLHVAKVITELNDEHRGGMIIILAPTRALLVQHQRTFQERLTLPADHVEIIDGGMGPAKRKAFYLGLPDEPFVFMMTPQTLSNDLLKDRFPRGRLVDLVFDEAHHAREDHPYVLIYKDLKEKGFSPRILAMTASPGDSEDAITSLCETLDIDPSKAIFKDRDDADVKPYVHPLYVARTGVAFPEEWRSIQDCLMQSMAEPIAWLVLAGVTEADVLNGKKYKKEIPRSYFLDLFKKYTAGDGASPGAMKIMSRLATCIKIHHAIELLEAEGLEAVLKYHETMLKSFKKQATKATAAVLADPWFNRAIEQGQAIVKSKDHALTYHPKLVVLGDQVKQFLDRNPSSRILIFATYRTSISMIVDYLGSNKQVRAHRFVGQATKTTTDKGMDRKKQTAILDKFRSGAFNVLVATSVAEEGLDIAECDLVIFYETVATVIRFIQRVGRTARKHAGNVFVLYTRDTMDEFKMLALDRKLLTLKNVYYSIKEPGSPKPKTKQRKKDILDEFFEPIPSSKPIEFGFDDPIPKRRPAISALKQVQRENPITINETSFLADQLDTWCEKHGVPAMHVHDAALPDVSIGRAIAVKILTVRHAFDLCVDNRIFGILDVLRMSYPTSFIVTWDDGAALEEGVPREIVVEWLETLGREIGIKAFHAGSIATLGTVVADLRVNIEKKDESSTHTPRTSAPQTEEIQ
jgi:Fanconi anemia group M protein